MPDFSCDIDITFFTPRKSAAEMCFQKSDFFRNFHPRIYLRLLLKRWFQFISNIFHTVVLSIYCLNVVWRKGIFWILLFRKFELFFFFSSPSNALYVTCRDNEQIYQMAPPAGQIFFQVKCIRCCFESMKTPSLM